MVAWVRPVKVMEWLVVELLGEAGFRLEELMSELIEYSTWEEAASSVVQVTAWLVAEMVGPDKILFGSDYPLLPPSRYLKEMEEAGLSEEWQEMILGKNLAKLLEW